MKWLAIINPFSGGRKTDSDLRRIRSLLQTVTAKCVISEYLGHAGRLAREATGFDGLVIVGGDGTLHEILSSIHWQQFLAIVPTGTGNSLARDLCLDNAASAIESIERESWLPIDLMHVSFQDQVGTCMERVSGSTIAFGYPAAAAKSANSRFKCLGKLCYPVAATFETFHQKHFAVQLGRGRDHRKSKLLTGLLINNTRHVANFLAFPGASLDDGRLEIMELEAGGWQQIAHNLAILSRSYFYTPASIQSAESVSVDLESPRDLMIDGEVYPEVKKLQVRVLPRRLRCIARNGIHS